MADRFKRLKHEERELLAATLLCTVNEDEVLIRKEPKKEDSKYSYELYNVLTEECATFLPPCLTKIQHAALCNENIFFLINSFELHKYDCKGFFREKIKVKDSVSHFAIQGDTIITCQGAVIRVLDMDGILKKKSYIPPESCRVVPLKNKWLMVQGDETLHVLKKDFTYIGKDIYISSILTCARGPDGYMYVVSLKSNNELVLRGKLLQNQLVLLERT